MGVSSLAAAIIGAQVGKVQLAVAAKILRMNAEAERSVAELIDAAQQNVDKLANVGAGIGTNIDITA